MRAALSGFCRLLLKTAIVAAVGGPVLSPWLPKVGAAAMDVSVEDGRLSADLGTGVSIADVLAAVAEQTGAQLSVRGDLGTARPQAFSALPLAEALPRLAQPNGLILEFAHQPAGGERRLIAIRAVAPGAGGGSVAGGQQISRNATASLRSFPGLWNYEKGDEPLPPVEERVSRLTKIAQARGEASAAALIYVLIGDPENAVRHAALGLLAGMRNPDARQALMQAAADVDPEVRIDALKALANRPDDRPVALLAQAAKGDGDPSVRVAAFELLSAKKDGEMVRAVLQGALNDADPQIREAAQTALRR